MKIVNITKFSFKDATSESPAVHDYTVKYNANEVGDDAVGDTYLQVNGLAEGTQVSAVGFVLNDSIGVPLKFADIANLGTADNIESDGIYLVISGALERLELSCNGTCDVIVKQIM